LEKSPKTAVDGIVEAAVDVKLKMYKFDEIKMLNFV